MINRKELVCSSTLRRKEKTGEKAKSRNVHGGWGRLSWAPVLDRKISQ